MTHLDEGTIHAWLDGALDAERSREVEAHVHDCRQCADAVAEARGLMAASSRILGALDEVPANVIPVAPARRRRSVWRAAPWVTGIAAALVLAVALRTDRMQNAEVAMSAPRQELQADSPRALAAAPPSDASASVAAPPPEPVAGPAPRNQVAQAPVTRGAVTGQVGGGAAAGAAASAAAPAPPLAEVTVTAAPAQRLAEESRQSQAANEAVSRERAFREEAAERRMAPQRSTVSDMRAAPAPASAGGAEGVVGCYVVSIPLREAGVVTDFAASAERRTRAAAPAAVASKAADVVVANRVMVRLDTLAGRSGFLVRLAPGDSSLGSWTRIGADSARLDLGLPQAVSVAASQRVPCP